MSHKNDVPQVLSGKEREEIYDWKADRQADWQGTSKGSSKGKGKDGYGSYGKGKESGSTGYGFDSGKVKGDGKGKGRKGKERSKETGLQNLRYLEISWDVSKFYDMFSIVFLQVRTDQLGDVRWYFSRRNNHWAQDGRPSDSTAMIRRRTQLGLVGMAPMAPMAVRWLHFPTGPTGCFTDFVNILEKHLFTIDSDDSAAFWSP